METRQLPGTELAFSPVTLGLRAIGGKYWGEDVGSLSPRPGM